VPKIVSSCLGKLEVKRHFTSGIACAMAGFARLVAIAPPARPEIIMSLRRMVVSRLCKK
jgi:hypothetical protein